MDKISKINITTKERTDRWEDCLIQLKNIILKIMKDLIIRPDLKKLIQYNIQKNNLKMDEKYIIVLLAVN